MFDFFALETYILRYISNSLKRDKKRPLQRLERSDKNHPK